MQLVNNRQYSRTTIQTVSSLESHSTEATQMPHFDPEALVEPAELPLPHPTPTEQPLPLASPASEIEPTPMPTRTQTPQPQLALTVEEVTTPRAV